MNIEWIDKKIKEIESKLSTANSLNKYWHQKGKIYMLKKIKLKILKEREKK